MTGRGDSRARIQLRQVGVIMLLVCSVTPVFNVLTSAPTLRSAIQGAVDGVLVTGLVGGYLQLIRDGYLRSWFRRRSFAADLAISSPVVVALFLVGRGVGQVVTSLDPGRFVASLTEPHLLFFALPYFVVLAVAMLFALQMNRMIGANVLRYFVAGRYHRPTAEERIFLFLDLEGSTTLAERLGSARYFELLRRFVDDLTDPIVASRGEIYQYAGDEVVVTWPLAEGVRAANCVRCFFWGRDAVAREAARYTRDFGTVPRFRAGLHGGVVTAGELGDLRRQIVFVGDILNTAARLEEYAKRSGLDLVVSDSLLRRLELPAEIEARRCGELDLRGKEAPVAAYSLSARPPAGLYCPDMAYNAWFQCINGCPGEFDLREVIYRCPTCGDLLEVQHDMDALRSRSAAAWIQLFDDRYRRNIYPYGSGVWGKKEWVVPFLANENIVSMYEGNSNLLWADRYGKQLHVEDLWIKQCGNSHTGSFKDLGMTVLVSLVKEMMAGGAPIDAVACASTGDTSAALGAYCAAAGIPSVVLLPKDKVSIAQLVQPLANGALVLSLDTDFDGCMAVVQEITKEKRIYLANSMNSLRIEGQKTVAIEIVQQFDWEVPDWIVIPGGNLGNVHALGQGFLMMQELGLVNRLPRICLAQAERANPLYRSFQEDFKRFEPIVAQPTLATAIQIGNPVSVKRAIRTLQRFNGVVEQASEQELADEAARADRTGMFNCPHTGVALAALRKLVDRKMIRSGERVVVLSTANGLKFADQKAAYHMGALDGIKPAYRNKPVELPADAKRVARTIARHVEKARALVS